MRSVAAGEGESSAEIPEDHLVLDVLGKGGVDFLLQFLSGIGGAGLWGVFSEESLGSRSLGCGLSGESLVSDRSGVDTGKVDLGAGAEGIDLVHSSDWDTIDLVRSGNGEKAGLELLEADNSPSSESTCEEDEDSAWFDTSSLWGFWSVSSWSFSLVICWVPLVFLDHLGSIS